MCVCIHNFKVVLMPEACTYLSLQALGAGDELKTALFAFRRRGVAADGLRVMATHEPHEVFNPGGGREGRGGGGEGGRRGGGGGEQV